MDKVNTSTRTFFVLLTGHQKKSIKNKYLHQSHDANFHKLQCDTVRKQTLHFDACENRETRGRCILVDDSFLVDFLRWAAFVRLGADVDSELAQAWPVQMGGWGGA